MATKEWPAWRAWELDLSPHLLKRMLDRSFNEVDLRLMFKVASGYHSDREQGRWVLETRHESRAWELIVEPCPDDEHLVVITAYPLE